MTTSHLLGTQFSRGRYIQGIYQKCIGQNQKIIRIQQALQFSAYHTPILELGGESPLGYSPFWSTPSGKVKVGESTENIQQQVIKNRGIYEIIGIQSNKTRQVYTPRLHPPTLSFNRVSRVGGFSEQGDTVGGHDRSALFFLYVCVLCMYIWKAIDLERFWILKASTSPLPRQSAPREIP